MRGEFSIRLGQLGRAIALALFSVLMAAGGVARAAAAEAAAQWDLRDLYASNAAWTSSYQRTRASIDKLDRYKGTLGGSADAMLAALVAISDARRETARLFAYAFLLSDEDLRIAPNLERKQEAQSLYTQLAEKTAWLAPEIQALGDAKVRAFIGQSPALARRFDFYLIDTLRFAPHTLGLEAEGVLAATGNVLAQPNNVFQQLVDAELPYPTIEISGNKVRLGQVGVREVPQLARPCRAQGRI